MNVHPSAHNCTENNIRTDPDCASNTQHTQQQRIIIIINLIAPVAVSFCRHRRRRRRRRPNKMLLTVRLLAQRDHCHYYSRYILSRAQSIASFNFSTCACVHYKIKC